MSFSRLSENQNRKSLQRRKAKRKASRKMKGMNLTTEQIAQINSIINEAIK